MKMLLEILNQAENVLELIFNKSIIAISTIIGIFLSAIGYPKETVLFIVVLIIIDFITKHYSIIIKNYNKFSIHNYLKGWKDKHLTSRYLKNGIGVKTIMYSPVLYMANKLPKCHEMMFGELISSILYSVLILVEISSIFENFIDCGYTEFVPLLKFVKRKESEILHEDTDETDKKNIEESK